MYQLSVKTNRSDMWPFDTGKKFEDDTVLDMTDLTDINKVPSIDYVNLDPSDPNEIFPGDLLELPFQLDEFDLIPHDALSASSSSSFPDEKSNDIEDNLLYCDEVLEDEVDKDDEDLQCNRESPVSDDTLSYGLASKKEAIKKDCKKRLCKTRPDAKNNTDTKGIKKDKDKKRTTKNKVAIATNVSLNTSLVKISQSRTRARTSLKPMFMAPVYKTVSQDKTKKTVFTI